MLNAFRHHCCHHSKCGEYRIAYLPSAQRLSASLLSSHAVHFAEVLRCLCSTPFGITAVITTPRTNLRLATRCAQRLSASLLSSRQIVSELRHLSGMCSTPFGITAVITSIATYEGYSTCVLNAFRHHCCHHTVSSGSASAAGSGAQRLSASLLSSRVVFRIRGITLGVVLNAFRHHCCHHSGAVNATAGSGLCSTPFGITAVITICSILHLRTRLSAQRLSASLLSSLRQAAVLAKNLPVLNAFRHHCCHHVGCVLLADDLLRCSTPFGITAVITSRNAGLPVGEMSAQRLSASLLSSLADYADAINAAQKCSTPFGITAVITSQLTQMFCCR